MRTGLRLLAEISLEAFAPKMKKGGIGFLGFSGRPSLDSKLMRILGEVP